MAKLAVKNEPLRRKVVVAPRKCIVCGKEFPGGPSAKYCPDCRVIRRRERERLYKQKPESAKRKLGSLDFCQKCGEEYTVTGGLQKYCPNCAVEEIRKNAAAHKVKYMADMRKNQPERVKEWKHRKFKPTNCIVCGKEFTPSHYRQNYCSEECGEVFRAWTLYNTGREKNNNELVSIKDYMQFKKHKSGNFDTAATKIVECRKMANNTFLISIPVDWIRQLNMDDGNGKFFLTFDGEKIIAEDFKTIDGDFIKIGKNGLVARDDK